MMEGEHIFLRTLEPEDIDFLVAMENDPKHWRVSGTLVPFSRKILTEYISSAQDLFTHRQIRFVIVSKSNQLVGLVDLFDYDPLHLRAGVGILIAPEKRRNGYAHEALSLIETYAKDMLKLKNLFCQINEENDPSKILFEKAGYHHSGTWKDWINTGEGWSDVLLFQKTIN